MPSVQVWIPAATTPLSASGIWPVLFSSQGQSSQPSVGVQQDRQHNLCLNTCEWNLFNVFKLIAWLFRFWKHLPQDRRRAALLHFLRPGGNPDVWYPARWSWRPSWYWAEENCCQNRDSLPGQTPNRAFSVFSAFTVHTYTSPFNLSHPTVLTEMAN